MKDTKINICPVTQKLADCSVVKQMRDYELRYNRILRHSWEEIYVFDDNLRFLEVSQGALKNLGYTWSELKELTVLDVKAFLSLEELQILVEPLQAGSENIINCNTAHKRKDGSTYDVDVRLQYITEEAYPVFIAMVTDVTERNKYEEELKALAFRDPGTDLYNRRFFLEQLKLSINDSKRKHSTIGLLLIDMDDFGVVNNTHGHLAGDAIIREFAKKIKTVFSRRTDVVARYGGDEFVVMCGDCNEMNLLRKCNDLIELFNEPYNHEGTEIVQTASVGLCVCSCDDCVVTGDDMIEGADEAMYEAKHSGKNAVKVSYR